MPIDAKILIDRHKSCKNTVSNNKSKSIKIKTEVKTIKKYDKWKINFLQNGDVQSQQYRANIVRSKQYDEFSSFPRSESYCRCI